jgi:ankyrin repeat protein/phage baseplate assembly protein W
MVAHGSPNGRSSNLASGRTTPSSIKFPSARPSNSRTRAAQVSGGRQRSESPMGSPPRSASRARESANYRRRDPSPHKGQDGDGEAVCNYDTNVTTLYELLESSNWEKARSRCRTHPQEVRTWIVRRDVISQKVRWKLLPLHAAVIFQSPTFVVSALIDNYPAAVSRRDDQGMLPLHLAFRYKEDNEDLLELLLAQYPKGVLMKDKRDRTPLEHGRGSKFSAKLMRLYADSAVTGSRALTMSGSPDQHVKSQDRLGGENDNGRVNDVIAEYENKTQTLKNMYEERIRMLQEKNKAALNHVRISTDEEKRKLVNCHMEEMETMRQMLNSNAGNGGLLIADLESEVNQLRSEIADAKAERDAANMHANELKTFADDLLAQMRQVLQDQEALQLMVSQQQQELDKAHTRRDQLIQSLLRHEQDERPSRVRRGTEIKQLIDSSRTSLHTLLAREPVDSGVKHHRPRVPLPAASLEKNTHQNYLGQEKTGHQPFFTGNQMKDDISAITENSNF